MILCRAVPALLLLLLLGVSVRAQIEEIEPSPIVVEPPIPEPPIAEPSVVPPPIEEPSVDMPPAEQSAGVAGLLIKCGAPGARVFINKGGPQEIPFHDVGLAPGKYRLRIIAPGYLPIEQGVELRAGFQKSIDVRLQPLTITLHAISVPPGANVVIDSLASATTPCTIDSLSVGIHSAHFRLDGYRSIKRSVVLSADRLVDSLRVTLVSNREADSIAAHFAGKRQRARRIVFGSLSAGFGIGCFAAQMQLQESRQKRDDQWERYEQAGAGTTTIEFTRLYDSYKSESLRAGELLPTRNVLGVLTGIAAVGLGLSIPF